MPEATKPRTENIWLSLACNVAIPAILLSKGDAWLGKWLQPGMVLVVALLFPVGYFCFDFFRRRQANMLSIIGFLGTLASGGLGLLKMDPLWVAVKEASVPLIIGMVVFVADRMGRPILRSLLLNETIINMPRINTAIDERGTRTEFEKSIGKAGTLLSGTFVFSGALNFLLARLIIKTHPEIDAAVFNQELGQMTLWSWPVIVLPTMVVFVFALMRLLKSIQRLSGLKEEELFKQKAT
ncbi:MAG: hypothetical protein LBV12_07910 [Puniceicoccales bacterium]|jgi:hypothetical protein|nr:hypothetical protein [Puniceicoccales bacterium]